MNAKTVVQLVEECFADEKVIRHFLATSLKAYRWHCRSFAHWLGVDALVDQITDETRPKYLEHLEAPVASGGRNYAPRLIRVRNQSILYFYRWLVAHGYLPALPDDRADVVLPKVKKPRRHRSTPAQARAMIAACDSVEDPYDRLLLCALITMFHDIPLRLMEQLNLEVRDIDLVSPDKEVFVRHGKGDKQRSNFLSDDGIAAVRAYVAVRPASALPYLWLHNAKLRVGDDWLYAQIRRLAQVAGVVDYRDVLPHACRRGTATRFRKAGMDLLQLMRMLGHTSVEITRIYTESDDEELAENRNMARLFDAPAAPAGDPPAPDPPAPPQAAPIDASVAAPSISKPPRNEDWRRRHLTHGRSLPVKGQTRVDPR